MDKGKDFHGEPPIINAGFPMLGAGQLDESPAGASSSSRRAKRPEMPAVLWATGLPSREFCQINKLR